MPKISDYPTPSASLASTDVALGEVGGATAQISIALIAAYVVSVLFETIGSSTAFNASVAIAPNAASPTALELTMTGAQWQAVRDALAALDEGSEVAIRMRGAFVRTTDAAGRFIGTTLFGNPADPQLASLFAAASAVTDLPFTYQLLPVTMGDVLTNA